MYELNNEQRLKLTIVLMEYLNAGDWKGLFEKTDTEEFAKQYTQFYVDDSWDDESLGQDSIDAIEFILSEDSANLKVIWELPGTQTMTKRKDEDLHREIEALIEGEELAEDSADVVFGVNAKVVADDIAEVFDNSDISNAGSGIFNMSMDISNVNPVSFDTNQSPYKALEDAESLLTTEGATNAYDIIHAALQGFLRQVCTSNSIYFDSSDAITILLAKVNEYIKGQVDTGLNDKTLSMLRASALMTDTINDLRNHHNQTDSNENLCTEADVKFAINLVRSVMSYIDEIIG